ncbi:hypothetical protein NDU88_002067 [Pleurodeles waltl]|uniref:Uncharacterized protein n=1 Tax=Pleurodeles waltl TaxID=8319 RepID=A0AAV7KUJ3_PLEWA|nr:hypothetical protein NDU88_002067 [Pleurodeles waltl]
MLPQDLRQALKVPIHEAGKLCEDCKSYRPILLLNMEVKALAQIVKRLLCPTSQKYNFPINYTIDVPRILIFRKRNVTQLLRNWKVNMEDLRLLWGSVSRNVLQKILAVLTPEKHPSWNFTHELLAIINAMVADMAPPQSEFVIQRIKRVLNPKPADAIKSVHPKALVDNCYRVLLVLYKDACNLKDASSRRRPLVPARSKSPSTPTAI